MPAKYGLPGPPSTLGSAPKLLQAKIRNALSQGGYWRTDTGGHLLEIGRHQIELSRDGRYCIAYALLPPPPAPPCGRRVEILEPPAWDQEGVALSPHAVRQFGGRHAVDEEAAADELFDLLDDAVVRAKHHRYDDGHHTLSVDGFTLALAPDGATVTGCTTVHAERTPSDVRNKVPSRFGKSRRDSLAPEQWAAFMVERDQAVSSVPREDRTAEIDDFFDCDRARIVPHQHPERRRELQAVRESLRRAKAEGRWASGTEGRWASGTEGRHILEHDARFWTISPNGRGVLSCEPIWHCDAGVG